MRLSIGLSIGLCEIDLGSTWMIGGGAGRGGSQAEGLQMCTCAHPTGRFAQKFAVIVESRLAFAWHTLLDAAQARGGRGICSLFSLNDSHDMPL